MGREIKFRAWDRDERRMLYFGLFDIYEGGLVLLRTDGRMDRDKQCDLQSDYVHVMQSTGLLDRHGKEIYEGDILTAEDGETLTVYWNEKMAGFGFTDGYGNFPLGELVLEVWEVTGNIMENKGVI